MLPCKVTLASWKTIMLNNKIFKHYMQLITSDKIRLNTPGCLMDRPTVSNLDTSTVVMVNQLLD